MYIYIYTCIPIYIYICVHIDMHLPLHLPLRLRQCVIYKSTSYIHTFISIYKYIFSRPDLAGSERAGDTGKNGDRTRRLEAAEINKSLLALKVFISSYTYVHMYVCSEVAENMKLKKKSSPSRSLQNHTNTYVHSYVRTYVCLEADEIMKLTTVSLPSRFFYNHTHTCIHTYTRTYAWKLLKL